MENKIVHPFNDIEDKVVLITGGYGYLGKEISNSFNRYKAKVYVLARDVDKFSAEFGKGTSIKFQYCDISDSSSIVDAIKAIYEIEGCIDVLINNATYVIGQNPLDISDNQWAETMEGVIGSIYKFIREISKYFIEAKQGKIINVSSMYGMVSPDFAVYEDSPEFLNPPHYGAGKAAVIQLTKYFAHYLGKHNIQVNCISPGPFPSEKVRENKKFIDRLAEKTALKRIGKPEDLSGAFLLLSSTMSDYITGQNIVVDGGWTVS